jgi:flagellin-like protein
MKGISPIIASVLLIAITMSIAVILAAYVTSYTRTATTSIPSSCIGGALFVQGTPTCTGGATGEISIQLEANYVTLSGFTADTRKTDGTVLATGVLEKSGTDPLGAGDIGTYKFGPTDCTDVDEVRVATTNCFNVRSDWTPIA